MQEARFLSVEIECAEHTLAAKVWKNSSVKDAQLLPLVVLVHQWGKLGGHGRLMAGMASQLAERGFQCITFDMRGVGRSSGSSTWTQWREVEDVIAVINWAVETFNKDVFLLGSSAGAPVAGSALEAHSRVKGAFLIGYPWGLWASMLFNAHFQRLQESHKPKMMVMGTRDEFTSVQVFNRKFDALQGPREKHIFEGLGHFELERPEYDSTMAEMCDRFIRGLLVPPEASEAQSNDIEAMQVTVLHAHA